MILIRKRVIKSTFISIIPQMKPSYHSHQILYVKNIGYARVADANTIKDKGKSNGTINSPNPKPSANANSNSDSVNYDVLIGQEQSTDITTIFDPDMFNIDADSPFGQAQEQVNLVELNTRKTSMQKTKNELERRSSTASLKSAISRQPAIVPMKLENAANVMVYCPQTSLMKKIFLKVRSLIQNKRKEITIEIEIVKTIDYLRNTIFKELGEESGYYSDVKILTVVPKLSELNIGSKTIWQCGLKDQSKLTFLAKFNFAFKQLKTKSQGQKPNFTLSNNNSTVSLAALPQGKSTQNALVIQAAKIILDKTDSQSTAACKINTQNVLAQLQQAVNAVNNNGNNPNSNENIIDLSIQAQVAADIKKSILESTQLAPVEKQLQSQPQADKSFVVVKQQQDKLPVDQAIPKAEQIVKTPVKTTSNKQTQESKSNNNNSNKTPSQSPSKKTEASSPVKKKAVQVPKKIHLQCNSSINSGLHYWEFKLQRLSINTKNAKQSNLVIGVQLNTYHQDSNNANQVKEVGKVLLENKEKAQGISSTFIKSWGFNPLKGKKVLIKKGLSKQHIQEEEQEESQECLKTQQKPQETKQITKPGQSVQQNIQEKNTTDSQKDIVFSDSDDEDYGSVCKLNDSIGVLLSVKDSQAFLVFYRNSCCLEECFQINIKEELTQASVLENNECSFSSSKNSWHLSPFINIAGDCQITLDSKANLPLDSYRYR